MKCPNCGYELEDDEIEEEKGNTDVPPQMNTAQTVPITSTKPGVHIESE